MSILLFQPKRLQAILKRRQCRLFRLTASGTPKVVTVALAQRARELRFKRASLSRSTFHRRQPTTTDGEPARANAIAVRTPYQSQSDARKPSTSAARTISDTHLSLRGADLRYGFYGDLDTLYQPRCYAQRMVQRRRPILGAGLGNTPNHRYDGHRRPIIDAFLSTIYHRSTDSTTTTCH